MTRIVNAMTVDVEDYFQATAFDRVVSRASWADQESRVEANTQRLLACFEAHGVRGTFFILGWVAERCPGLVRRIASAGHEIGSHGYHHQLVYLLTPEQFRQDIRRAKAVIEDATGCRVRGYRAPSFSIVRSNLWALDVLIEEGHEYDASIYPIHHDRYGIPDAPRQAHVIERPAGAIVEIPAPTVRLGRTNLPIAGGGYFRLLPYAATRWGIRRVNERDGDPVVFYLHPWEIDPGQPRLLGSRLSALRHYVGLGHTHARLERLFRDFSFDTLSATLEACAPSVVPAVASFAHAK